MTVQIFQPDNHSVDTPEFFPVPPESARKITRLLKQHYPLTVADDTTVVSIGRVNLNSCNFRVANWYVKLFPETTKRAAIAHFPSIISALTKAAIPVGGLLQNNLGATITDFSDGDSNGVLFVQQFIDATFYQGTAPQLQTACETMIKLRDVAGEMTTPTAQATPYHHFNPITEVENIAVLLKQQPQNIVHHALFPRLAEFREIAVKYESLRPQLCYSRLNHLDLHPHNLLFSEQQLLAVLDLESFRAMPHQISTAFGAFKLARKSVATERLPLTTATAILGSFFDLPNLLALAQSELLRRLLLIARLNLAENDSRWNADLAKHLAGLAETAKLFV